METFLQVSITQLTQFICRKHPTKVDTKYLRLRWRWRCVEVEVC